MHARASKAPYHRMRLYINISMKRSKCIALTHDLQIETADIDWMI